MNESNYLAELTPLKGTRLEVLVFPHPTLLKKSISVTAFDDSLKELCRNMLFTMYEAPGIGLAAPQIGLNKRVIVIDVDFDVDTVLDADGEEVSLPTNLNPRIFINPIIRHREGEYRCKEGCLSLPEVFEDVVRSKKIVIDYHDLDGRLHTLEAEDMLAVCIQHESDHLDGILYWEHLSSFKRNFYKKKFLKDK